MEAEFVGMVLADVLVGTTCSITDLHHAEVEFVFDILQHRHLVGSIHSTGERTVLRNDRTA